VDDAKRARLIQAARGVDLEGIQIPEAKLTIPKPRFRTRAERCEDPSLQEYPADARVRVDGTGRARWNMSVRIPHARWFCPNERDGRPVPERGFACRVDLLVERDLLFRRLVEVLEGNGWQYTYRLVIHVVDASAGSDLDLGDLELFSRPRSAFEITFDRPSGIETRIRAHGTECCLMVQGEIGADGHLGVSLVDASRDQHAATSVSLDPQRADAAVSSLKKLAPRRVHLDTKLTTLRVRRQDSAATVARALALLNRSLDARSPC
jgi:hypothetical protein